MTRLTIRSSHRLLTLSLAVLAAVSGCAEPAQPLAATGTGAADRTAAVAQDTAPTIRQGPFRVTCYKDESVVFEHGTIYRVYRPQGEDAGWSYETGDGLKYRGRIGENVNCVWQ